MIKAVYLSSAVILFSSSLAQAQNTGIGTNNPQQKLHVAGNIRVDAMAGAGNGMITINPNGDFGRINFSGNANDILKGDGTFGAAPSASLPAGSIIGSANFPDSGLLKAGFSFLGEQSSPFSIYRSYPGGVSTQYSMLPTYENGNPAANVVPQARTYASHAWTGSEMLIWGGVRVAATTGYTFLEDGAKYNPSTDSWTPISKTNAPVKRAFASAVWTGTEMLIWGGTESANESINATTFNFTNTGGRYNPATNTWTPTNLIGAPTARTQAAAVWTGTVMVVFGGNSGNTVLSNGGRYNPSTNSWLSMATLNAPVADYGQTRMFWDASLNLVYVLGENTTGARYNPITNVWTAMAPCPTSYNKTSAVQVGNQIWIYGINGKIYQYTGSTNSWTMVSPPSPMDANFEIINSVWTGFEVVYFGYIQNQGDAISNSFYRYNAAGNYLIQDQTYYNHLVKEGSVLCNAGTMVIKWGGDNVNLKTGIPSYDFYPEGLRYFTVGGTSYPSVYYKISSANIMYLYRKD